MTHKRKENAERAKQMFNAALDTLAVALEGGHSDGLRQHLEAMARFFRYSFGNQLLISAQRPEATNVKGFRTWLKNGRSVTKGEKGILIRAPYTVRKGDDGENDQDRFVGFRAAYVFDISQTVGDELPTIGTATGDPGANTNALKEFATSCGIALEYEEDLAAHGISHGGRITLRNGLEPAEEFTTLVHELAHERLHKSTEGAKRPQRLMETEAEAVAFVVSQAAGLNTVQASADYIHLYQGDSAMLWDSLERIQKSSAELIACLNTDGSCQVAA